MNTFETIRENWSEIKIGMKSKYPQLTEGDLTLEDAYEDEFLKNLQMKTGKTRETLLAEMDAIALNEE